MPPPGWGPPGGPPGGGGPGCCGCFDFLCGGICRLFTSCLYLLCCCCLCESCFGGPGGGPPGPFGPPRF